MTRAEEILKDRYPHAIVDELLRSYGEIKQNLLLRRFKSGELEGGFFVEAVRRILEYALHSKEVTLVEQLPTLSDNEMRRYENAKSDDAFRLHIPRVLRSIYSLRNKRGVAHLGPVSANLIDCTYVAAACDWVLAEIIRQVAQIPPTECQELIDGLVQRKIPVIFQLGEIQRVLDTNLITRDEILVLLYHSTNGASDAQLREWTEYKQWSRFKEILQELHSNRLLEYTKAGHCVLTPKGLRYVDTLLLKGH